MGRTVEGIKDRMQYLAGLLLFVTVVAVAQGFLWEEHWNKNPFRAARQQRMVPNDWAADSDWAVGRKRGSRPLVRITFPCNGYDNLPRCLNGGKGPRTQWMRKGQLCTCWCPVNWRSPECADPSNQVKLADEE